LLRLLSIFAGTAVLALAVALPASAHPQSPQAIDACISAVEGQIEQGTAAGGGPKEGFPGPANCDHFFFSPFAPDPIGQPHSGGPPAPQGPKP
jgi:hypothetical protein